MVQHPEAWHAGHGFLLLPVSMPSSLGEAAGDSQAEDVDSAANAAKVCSVEEP